MNFDRRDFFRAALVGAGALALQETAVADATEKTPSLPDSSVYERDPEGYWAAVRKLFLIPADEIYLNNATCGSTPLPVLKAVFDAYRRDERLDDPDPEKYPLYGYYAFDQYRQPVAEFLGVSKDEIAIVRNATEANAIMANGLDLKAGDEILMSDQEHPSGEGPWELRAKRQGLVIKKFVIPKPPQHANEILNAMEDRITARTRVIFVSQITTVTGVVLPVREICALARSKGLISMVDGAQAMGMMPVNVREIGCDFYGSSPHKWLMSPKGSGVLFVRDEMIDRVWSNTTTEGWDNPKLRADRFQRYGSANLPVVEGMVASVAFAKQIGLDRIERRHRELADYAHAELLKRGAESWTSPSPAMRCGIATVNLPMMKTMGLEEWAWQRHKIRLRGGAPSKLRFAAGYYVARAEVDRFLAALDEYRTTS